jgi:hypothetical protein
VAEKAKNRNKNVPMNSPRKAMKWFRTIVGIHERPGRGRVAILGVFFGLKGMLKMFYVLKLVFNLLCKFIGCFLELENE